MGRICVVLTVSIACVFPLAAGAAVAQPAPAEVTGVARAPDGSRLPGVVLRLLNEDSGTSIESVTSGAGLFVIRNLPPGRYRLEAHLAGFEPRRISGIAISAGESVRIDLQLDIAVLRETVRVVGDARRDNVEALEIRESRARDVGEALAILPGVTRVRKGGIANDIVLRGFKGKDVTVLIDGQRLDGACPGQMDPPAFHVDFAEVTRVEVSRGPFDVKNQGGLAGIVNIVTERPQRGLHGTANLDVASESARAGSGSGSYGRAHLALLGGAGMRQANPYKDGHGNLMTEGAGYLPAALDGVNAYDVWTAWGRAAVVPRDGMSLHLSYTRQSADRILYPYLQMDAVYDNADRAGAHFESANLPGGWSTFAAHAYYTFVDHWMTDELRTTGLGKMREYSVATRAKTKTIGGRAEIARGAFTAGLEASRRNWNTQTTMAMRQYVPQAAMPDVTIDVAGAFATYSAGAGSRWRLEAGGRLDYADSAADPRLANTAVYAAYHGTRETRVTDTLPAGYARAQWAGERWSAVAGVGHSVRLPDQQERFYALQRMGADWVGNPLLEPSRNTGGEGELRYSHRGVDVGMSAFVYRVDDAIRVVEQARMAPVPGVMNTMARSYANVDALASGVEIAGTVPVAPSVSLSTDFSFVRSVIRGESPYGKDMPEMPPARVRVRLRVDRARWSAAAEAVGAAEQVRVAADLKESPTSGYVVFNLRGGARFGHVTVSAALDNVFDTLYAEHLSYQRDPFRNGFKVYEPGRTLSVNLGVRF